MKNNPVLTKLTNWRVRFDLFPRVPAISKTNDKRDAFPPTSCTIHKACTRVYAFAWQKTTKEIPLFFERTKRRKRKTERQREREKEKRRRKQASISLSDNCGLLSTRAFGECIGTRFAAHEDSYLKGWQSKVKGHYPFVNLFYIILRGEAPRAPPSTLLPPASAHIIRIIPRKGTYRVDTVSQPRVHSPPRTVSFGTGRFFESRTGLPG